MTSYRVTFFKDLLSSDGHEFRCPQQTIEIRRARSPERALKAAQERLARHARVHNWWSRADGAEIEPLEARVGGIDERPARRKAHRPATLRLPEG